MHQKLHPKTVAITLALAVLVFLLIVLFALSKEELVTNRQNAALSGKKVPALVSPQEKLALPTNVNKEVLNSQAVSTCATTELSAAAPALVNPPAAPTDKTMAAADAYTKSLKDWAETNNAKVQQYNDWQTALQAKLKSCYNTSLAAKYSTSSNDYTQQRWK